MWSNMAIESTYTKTGKGPLKSGRERCFLGVALTSATYEAFFAYCIINDVWEHFKAISPLLSVETFFYSNFKIMFFFVWRSAHSVNHYSMQHIATEKFLRAHSLLVLVTNLIQFCVHVISRLLYRSSYITLKTQFTSNSIFRN